MKNTIKLFVIAVAAIIIFPACMMLLEPFAQVPQNQGGQAAVRTVPAGPAEGTYSFFPRVTASMNAIPINDAYIDKIVVRGRTMLVYITGTPRGISDRGPRGHNTAAGFKCIITDSERPSRTWQSVGATHHETEGVIVSFNNVTSTRFTIETEYWNGTVVFEEITLGDPDPILNIPPPAAGTYTFWPRIRASMNGIPIDDAYIDKVVVRGRNTLIYVVSVPRGSSDRGARGHNTAAGFKCYLTDLDRPSRVWNSIGAAYHATEGVIISFENVTGTNFSLETEYWNGLVFFENFSLNSPDTN